MKIAEAKGNTLEGFNTVVAAFGETIGIGTVKRVHDIGLPVFQHFPASVEFGKPQPVAGIQPPGEQLRRGGAALCVHSVMPGITHPPVLPVRLWSKGRPTRGRATYGFPRRTANRLVSLCSRLTLLFYHDVFTKRRRICKPSVGRER